MTILLKIDNSRLLTFTDKKIICNCDDFKKEEKSNRYEYLLIDALIKADGKTCTRDALFQAVWGDQPVALNSLNNLIYSVRKKLKIWGCEHVVDTVPRIGYRIDLSVATVLDNADELLKNAVEKETPPTPITHNQPEAIPECISVMPEQKEGGYPWFLKAYNRKKWLLSATVFMLLLLVVWGYGRHFVANDSGINPQNKPVEAHMFTADGVQAIYTNTTLNKSQILFKLIGEQLQAVAQKQESDMLYYFDFSRNESVLVSCAITSAPENKGSNVLVEIQGVGETVKVVRRGVEACIARLENRCWAPDWPIAMVDNKGELVYEVNTNLTKRTDHILFDMEAYDSQKAKLFDFSCSSKMRIGAGEVLFQCQYDGDNDIIAYNYDEPSITNMKARFGFIPPTEETFKKWVKIPLAYRKGRLICSELLGCTYS